MGAEEPKIGCNKNFNAKELPQNKGKCSSRILLDTSAESVVSDNPLPYLKATAMSWPLLNVSRIQFPGCLGHVTWLASRQLAISVFI